MTEPVQPDHGQTALARRNRRIMVICLSMVAVMTGLSFAAVPLYGLFCRVTGFGGTPIRSADVPNETTGRYITVRFNADTDRRLSWIFKPDKNEIKVEIGRSAMAYFTAENRLARETHGVAVYNVTPDKAGPYFHKVQCFCFGEQTLAPGEHADLPVLFYVDSSILDDPKMDDVDTITLSYTFFPADADDVDRKISNYLDPDHGKDPTALR